MLLLTVMSMSVLAWNFQAEATYHPRQTVHHEHSANMENLLPENLLLEVVPKVLPEVLLEVSHPVNLSRTFYGIMFDAGSTGTRIHIYKFIQKDPGECFLSLFLCISFTLPQEPIGRYNQRSPRESVCCWVIRSVV